MLTTLLAFVFALGALITFHELGHYWVARRCGVRILRFSIGFGPVLARRIDRRGTEWALSAIPLGGYVKMLDDSAGVPDPGRGAVAADEPVSTEAFNRKSLAQRTAIVAAGPIANLVLAVLLYAVLALMGRLEPAAVLAPPAAGTPAALAGIQGGDTLVAVDGRPVRSWTEARWRLLEPLGSGGTLTLGLQGAGGGETRRLQLAVPATDMAPEEPDPLAALGLGLSEPTPRLGPVMADGAAAQAGLREGDVVEAIGGHEAPSVSEMIALISAHPGQALPMQVRRDGTRIALSVTPQPHVEDGRTIGRIGVMVQAQRPLVELRSGVLESLWTGLGQTIDMTAFSLRMMARMVTGSVSLRNVSGPVTIADYAGQTARQGVQAYLGFLALISVSIGVLNLLPIPMLDGGHLLFYLIEAVRGRPVSEQLREGGQRIGVALLFGLMSLALFNDLTRLFS